MKQKLLALAIALSTSSVWAGGITTGLGLSDGNGAGFYAGASVIGLTGDVKDACDEADIDCQGWKLYGGYKFNKNFGIEGGYYQLIDAEDDVSNLKLSGLGIAATAAMPLGDKAEVFGKLGALSTEAEVTYNSPKNGIDSSKKSTDLLVGIGAGYKFTQNLGIRGEYEHVTDDEGSMGLISGGVTFSTY